VLHLGFVKRRVGTGSGTAGRIKKLLFQSRVNDELDADALNEFTLLGVLRRGLELLEELLDPTMVEFQGFDRPCGWSRRGVR
jgi:hypothetical protein